MPNDNHDIHVSAPPDAQEQASALLDSLKQDSEWTGRPARGDHQAAEEWDRLFSLAHGQVPASHKGVPTTALLNRASRPGRRRR
jgi:hypothetical protein